MLRSTSYLVLIMAFLPFGVALVNTPSPIETAILKDRLSNIELAITKKYRENVCRKENDIKTFIFPGAGGVDVLVEELQAKTPNSIVVDWKELRGNLFTAAYDGEAVGEAIANLVSSRENQDSNLHFIGISVGAFCANAAATISYQNDPSLDVRLTLLDPFCGRGVFGNTYGRDNFGKYATTAVHILNTDDPVPTTNDPLPKCFCLDVTQAPERKTFVPPPGDTMHSWPLAYFARHFQEAEYLLERGRVVEVKT